MDVHVQHADKLAAFPYIFYNAIKVISIMVESAGILFALIAALAWGSSLVPFKLAGKFDDTRYTAFVTLGIFLSTLLAMPFLNFAFTFNWYGLISGIMWAVSNVFAVTSIRLIGLSRQTPIIGGLIILASFLWGILFFQEQLTSIIFALIGIVFLILGIPLVMAKENKSKISVKGLAYAAIAGIIFGSYVTPLKLSGVQISEYIFSMVSGILLTGWIVYLVSLRLKRQKMNFTRITYGMSSGVLWTIGNITSLFAINSLGLGIGFPLTQLQLLIGVAWGVFYFKEVKEKQATVKIIFGAVLLLLGAIFLTLSK